MQMGEVNGWTVAHNYDEENRRVLVETPDGDTMYLPPEVAGEVGEYSWQ